MARPDRSSTTTAVEARPSRGPGRRRAHYRLLTGVAVALALMTPVTWLSWPLVEPTLRESFTRLPEQYSELSFAGTPTLRPIDGGRELRVDSPVTLVHHGDGPRTYQVTATASVASSAASGSEVVSLDLQPEQSRRIDLAPSLPFVTEAVLLTVSTGDGNVNVHYLVPAVSAGGEPR